MRLLILLSITAFIAYFAHSKQDDNALAFSFSNQSNCLKAVEHADLSNNLLLKKIILTRAILDDKCKAVSFHNAIDFVSKHPDWSQNNFLKKRLEALIDQSSDKRKILKWFELNPPKTPEGFKHFAFAATSVAQKDRELFKLTWMHASFTNQEYEAFLKAHKSILTQEDHVKRIENLLWSARIDEANQMLVLIDKTKQPIYQARIAIEQGDCQGEKIFNKLSHAQQHNSGVLYSYLKYQKSLKKAPIKQELELAMHIPEDLEHADSWWAIRSYYIREFMALDRYSDAYKLASKHNTTDRLHITQAEWLAGWLSLRFLHKPKIALGHFEKIYQNSSRPITLARAAYWIARAHKALGQKKQARQWFDTAAKYGHTFYAQMAQHELGYKTLKIQPAINLQDKDIKQVSKLDGPKIIQLLVKYNQNSLALAYIKNLFSMSRDPIYVAYCLEKIRPYNNHSFKVEVAREAAFYGVLHKEYGYPVPFDIHKPLIEKSLIYSIIRQESSFDQYAIDPTDGRGLMQLIPSTAKTMAKSLKIPYNEEKLLYDKDYNIILGSKHLADHIDYYAGSYLLAIPAYNAGTHRVDKWIVNNGDPRKIKDLYQILDWIEKIPFITTRDYVHRVLENLQIYRSIVNKDQGLNIVTDLTKQYKQKPVKKSRKKI